MTPKQFTALITYIDEACNFAVVEYGSAPGGVHSARLAKTKARDALQNLLCPLSQASQLDKLNPAQR